MHINLINGFFSHLKGGGLGIGIGGTIGIAGVVIGIICCIRKKTYRKCRLLHFGKDKDISDIPPVAKSRSINHDRDSSPQRFSAADNDFDVDETKNSEDKEKTKVKVT